MSITVGADTESLSLSSFGFTSSQKPLYEPKISILSLSSYKDT